MNSEMHQKSKNADAQHGIHSDTMQTLIPTKNKPALLSYYFGVFGLIPFFGLPLSILAIVTGFLGLSQFKQTPTPGAKVHAIVGLILGFFQLLIFATFVILMFVNT